MNVTSLAVKAGISRGVTEFKKSLQAPQDFGYYVIGTGIFLAVIFVNRDNTVEGTTVPLSLLILPGVLAMVITVAAAYGLATLITTEREDGTLLRAKSLPNGMTGYVFGQVTRTSLESAFTVLILIIPATFIVEGIWANGTTAVLQLVVFFVLGLLALLPFGFVIGAVCKNPRSVGGWGMLVMGGLVFISGIFAPLVAMASWVQVLGQIFPLYWLGLGMRSALLPDAAVAVEIGESWRVLETFAVLGAWSVIGLLLAPVLLRRMARRESGSSVEARRQSALQRV